MSSKLTWSIFGFVRTQARTAGSYRSIGTPIDWSVEERADSALCRLTSIFHTQVREMIILSMRNSKIYRLSTINLYPQPQLRVATTSQVEICSSCCKGEKLHSTSTLRKCLPLCIRFFSMAFWYISNSSPFTSKLTMAMNASDLYCTHAFMHPISNHTSN